MLRFIRRLEGRDLSLAHSMIPLGSCTMKLNATAEMEPISWPELGDLHPFAPADQAAGYLELFRDLEGGSPRSPASRRLAAAERRLAGRVRGAAGDPRLARSARRGAPQRLPDPGLGARHQPGVGGDGRDEGRGGRLRRARGNVDLADLAAKAEAHAASLAALMVTYPSTHGVFEEEIREICAIVHRTAARSTSTAPT
jgi:glycine dehydrogenase